MSADIVPIGCPSRAELWRRLQLARAVLNRRTPNATTVTIALGALDGAPADALMRRREPDVLPLRFVVDWARIARDLSAACVLRGVSQRRLAAAMGVSQSTVRRVLRGEVLTADVLVSVVAWLYPEEARPKWIVSTSVGTFAHCGDESRFLSSGVSDAVKAGGS